MLRQNITHACKLWAFLQLTPLISWSTSVASAKCEGQASRVVRHHHAGGQPIASPSANTRTGEDKHVWAWATCGVQDRGARQGLLRRKPLSNFVHCPSCLKNCASPHPHLQYLPVGPLWRRQSQGAVGACAGQCSRQQQQQQQHLLQRVS